jgi:predicted transcriptional regulator
MATGYEPNIEGAIAVLRDLMIANSVNMVRQPYEPNYRGLVDSVLDLKEGFPTFAPAAVVFNAVAFEDVDEGEALFMRTSDGQVGKASAANGLIENAIVVGFANVSALAGESLQVAVAGLKTISGLDAGDLFFLSATTSGAITATPPSSAGQAVVRIGEAATATKLSIQIEPPIKLS